MKVDYCITVSPLNGNYTGPRWTFVHESEIVCHSEEDKQRLAEEVILTLPSETKYIVQDIYPAYEFVKQTGNMDSYKELYEKSKKLWEEVENSKEEKQFKLKQTYKQVVRLVENLEKDTKELELLDSQEHLDFLDELNKLSVSH
jgi:hypothetical protein